MERLTHTQPDAHVSVDRRDVHLLGNGPPIVVRIANARGQDHSIVAPERTFAAGRRAPNCCAGHNKKGDTDRKAKHQQRRVARVFRISNQFPASFVELNACRQTHDIFANESVVKHLPSCFTLRPHGLVSEKAAVWWYEHPHVYEW